MELLPVLFNGKLFTISGDLAINTAGEAVALEDLPPASKRDR